VILVDTHVAVWLALEPSRISKKGKAAIDEARENGDGLGIADVSRWELSILVRKGRIHLTVSLESFLTEVERRFAILPITGQVCVRALALPAEYPKDPADRIIGATALVEGVPLVTADRDIQRSKAVLTIW
jgi:PIN domain nuclease of toxin-antitoxin system